MNKKILLLCFIIIPFYIFGQKIQKLEKFLSISPSRYGEYGEKIEKAKKLQKIDPFNYIANEYICRYYSHKKIDSVTIYFENLISKYPLNAEPYILRSELHNFEKNKGKEENYLVSKINYLKKGLEIQPKNQTAIYKLAETYYNDFIFPLKKEKDWGIFIELDDDSTMAEEENEIKQSTFEHAADSSLVYFYKLWDLSKENREIIYFPIKQLECYLNKSENSQIPNEFKNKINQCYFPIYYFVNLKEKWECDFTEDYLYEIEVGKSEVERLKIQLNNLKESCLYDAKIPPNSTIYRFTWLRTFDNPIAIRIEKNENKIMLYWKVGKGDGGYAPIGLKKSGKKKLNLKQWDNFEKLLRNFDNLPNKNYAPFTERGDWIIEKKKHDSFKAHKTNWQTNNIMKPCLYLLNLANITDKNIKKHYN